MLKYSLVTASIALGIALVPAQAQPPKMSCTETDMAKMEADATQIKDTQKKEMAVKEMKMARDMMAKNDQGGCVTHMENAMKMSASPVGPKNQ